MSITICRGKIDFKAGIASIVQLQDWFDNVLEADVAGLAMVGRSNVGKSSLINSIFGNNVAKISKTPGKTKQINIFEFNLYKDDLPLKGKKYYLFDLPGYGHATVSKEMKKNWDALIDLFFNLIGSRVMIINIQDARHPSEKSDQAFVQYMQDKRLNTVLVLNKIDKIKRQKELHQLNLRKKEIFAKYKWVKYIHFISAQDGVGVEELKGNIINYLIPFLS